MVLLIPWLPFPRLDGQARGLPGDCLPCAEDLWPGDGASRLPRMGSLAPSEKVPCKRSHRTGQLVTQVAVYTVEASPLGLALSNLGTGFPASVSPGSLPSLSPTYHSQVSLSPVLRFATGQCGSQQPLGMWQGNSASTEPCLSEVEALEVSP